MTLKNRQMPKVILKAGKEKAIRDRHHWIFSGAIHHLPKEVIDGAIASVYSFDHLFLGQAYFNRQSDIIGRMIAFTEEEIEFVIQKRLQAALLLRAPFFDQQTTGYRLVNGEGDELPGLIVDRYSDVLVLQISTLGMEQLKPLVIKELIALVHPRAIYEKSNASVRKKEGLANLQGFIYGDSSCDTVDFLEAGLTYRIHLQESQKTGFFLDHREMRKKVKELAKNRTVLNAFCYTGGFTLSAIAGGAKSTTSVDISKEAVQMVQEHVTLNGFNAGQQRYECADLFKFLRTEELTGYDLIILDPPAFAKKRADILSACRGYKDLNRLALQKIAPRSFVVTCSCSHYVDDDLFQKVVFQAALEAKRRVKVVGRHLQAPDHPVSLYHRETHYLKSLLLYVE